MNRKILLFGSGIFLYLSVNSQNYNLLSSCLNDESIEIDTCIADKDTIEVIHYNDYLIHARCTNKGTSETNLKVIAIFKHIQYPTLGYSQIMDSEVIGNIIKEIMPDYGVNELRIAQSIKYKREEKLVNQLTKK